ncbi:MULTISPECIES: hypothetical protein [unclassified Bradyrhizobium]|uniref:hypothetical protein n=1 Tax=unclassified Bradyrhizobium TaxID=2631580 RepID=UPI001C64F96D|nr:hypothetical protein [Bradyrhizobium sp. BR 10261]MBW7963612.1 hypothetical protein [Bradyrhizobium sp. BR 10261]
MTAISYAIAKAQSRNIDRYYRLLNTRLSDVERNYVESRVLEQQAALHAAEEREHAEKGRRC